jgi:hypothetical protein
MGCVCEERDMEEKGVRMNLTGGNTCQHSTPRCYAMCQCWTCGEDKASDCGGHVTTKLRVQGLGYKV